MFQEKNGQIRNLETNINKEHEHVTITFEKAKLIHLEQHKEMEKQIEIVRHCILISMGYTSIFFPCCLIYQSLFLSGPCHRVRSPGVAVMPLVAL